MQFTTIDRSTILIVNDIEETIKDLSSQLPIHQVRVVKNDEKSEFQMAQAQLAVKEAYISSFDTKYILLCAKTFRNEAQNSLLKVLEEPPKNIIFIIITTTRNTLLPTILSRMPNKYLKKSTQSIEIDLDFLRMDLKELYAFLKQNQKISKDEAKATIEATLYKINSQKIKLSQKELDAFSKALKLLELNSRPIHVLATLFLTIIQRKR